MAIYFPPNGGGGGGGTLAVSGNGYVVKNGSQYLGREIVGVYPSLVNNGSGADGPLEIRSAVQRVLASGLIDGTLTTDQSLPILGADEFIIRQIVFTRATAVPDAAMAGGVYTLAGKLGQVLIPATTTFASLTGPLSKLEIDVDTGEISRAQWVHISLTTPNPSPLKLMCYVLGDVLNYATA